MSLSRTLLPPRLLKVQVAVAVPLPPSVPPAVVQVPDQVVVEPALAVAIKVTLDPSSKSAWPVLVSG